MADETNVVLFSVWTTNGGPISTTTQAKIERAVERTIKEIEEKDGVRLLTTTTKA